MQTVIPKSGFERYFWTGTYVIVGDLLGIIFVIIFAYIEKLNWSILVLWAFAYLVMGGLLGFIFSVPKIISENRPALPATTTDNLNLQNAATRGKVEENTNLTQISDWLTKILIGASLVQLKEIPKFIMHVAQVMAEGIRKNPTAYNPHDAVTIMCVAVILFFVTWGFISGYIVMKLVLTEQFAENDTM